MTRIVTAIGLIAFAVYLVFFSPQIVFIAGALLVGVLCYLEFGNLIAAHGIRRSGLIGILLGVVILLRPQIIVPAASVWLMFQLVLLLRRRSMRDIAPEAACTLLGVFYCFAPWRFAIDLRAISIHLLFFTLALNWVGDSTAFYIGRRFGKHRLAPTISPAKSWEGAAASVTGSVLFGILYLHYLVSAASILQVFVMAVAGNVAGQLGDLAESAIKRGAGLKDSGALLPGHGGALDRLDSSLFALPAIYIIIQSFNGF